VQSDSLGHVGTSAPRTFRVDTTAPLPTIAGPGDGQDPMPSITGAAGDAQGDAAELLVRLWPGAEPSGAPAHELRPARSGTAWSARPPALAPGTWTVVAWQTDAAGNIGAARRTFTVTAPPPPADTRAPQLTFGKLPRLAALSKSAYRTGVFGFAVSADEAAAVRGELMLAAATAKKLGVKGTAAATKYVVVAKGSVAVAAGKPGKLVLRLGKTTRARLRRAARLSLQLRLTTTDAAGNARVTQQKLRVVRPKRG
jgi:hypothetical protein